ncbi:MAG: hypothetical protein ABSG91_00480 [Syntrophobacteraceae bacterium]|jgi:hypothetical protein
MNDQIMTRLFLNDIREYCNGDREKLSSFFEVVPVPLSESMGTMTGKYSAKDKITSSGRRSAGIMRVLLLA